MSDPTDYDEGYDDLLDAIDDSEGYYLSCPSGHGSLPPRRVCPVCGDPQLRETPIPDVGRVVTYTVVHVPTPQFDGAAPYVTAIAEFGDVRLTGLVAADPDAVSVGADVSVGVETFDSERRIVFETL